MGCKILSPKRRAILEYIESFAQENGYAPSVREIGDAVGLRSPSTVHAHLRILEENGYLQKSKGKTRTLSLPGQPGYRNVPVIGTVRAGQPILAVEDAVGYVPFEGSGEGLFALNVRGDSMKDAAILEDDVVIVRPQPTADNGQIVVALIDDEATVKRLRLEKGHVWLMPENPAYQPIDGEGCSILGVVVAVYRYHVK